MLNFSFGRRIGASFVVLGALGFAACKSDSKETVAPAAQTVVIIGTDSTESKVLADIYTRALEAGGFRVARRSAVADLAGGYAALKSGAADMFVTHTGELLTYLAANEPAAASTSTTEVATTTSTSSTSSTVAETTTTAADTTTTEADTAPQDSTGDTSDASSTTISPADSTTTTVSTAGEASAVSLNLQSNLIGEILPDTLQIGAPSYAEDKPVIACKTAVSTGLSLLSDLAKVSSDLRIAGTADFETGDPFGLVGFKDTYGATFKEFVPVAADKIADAFAPVADDTTSTTAAASTAASTETTVAEPVETDADCGAFASSLDPTISVDMVVMDDDKNWVGNNGVIPVMTATTYTPGVSQIVDQVSQSLTTVDLREMTRQVDDGRSASSVAGQWLQLVGLSGS